MKSSKVRQVVLPLITAMIWGSSFVTQSLSAGHLGCFSFNALRSIPAALALLRLPHHLRLHHLHQYHSAQVP